MSEINLAFLDVLSRLSIIIASIVAIYGINAWRREYKGKKDIELAEETLVLFYKAKDAISAIRNPFGFSGEGTSRKAAEYETETEKRFKDQAYAFFERYEKRQDVFNNLLSMRYRFMARFGKDKAELFDSTNKIVNEIMISANYWAEMMIDWDESNKEEIKRARDVIWHSGRDDKISAQIEKIIADIENICKPIINPHDTLFMKIKGYLKILCVSIVKRLRTINWKKR